MGAHLEPVALARASMPSAIVVVWEFEVAGREVAVGVAISAAIDFLPCLLPVVVKSRVKGIVNLQTESRRL